MWIYNDREFTQEEVGDYKAFVYVITNLTNNKRYYGKKRFIKKTTKPPLKGAKRKRITYTSSDWQEYYGSNEEIQKDVEELGPDKFHREILYLCNTLGESSYWEAYYQLTNHVLLHPELYYNSWVQCKIHRKHLGKK